MIRGAKTLGIIGGMGPLATHFFYEKIIAFTKASCDQEHLPVLIHANPQIPNRIDGILNNQLDTVIDYIQEAAQCLKQSGADLLVLPCNTAHHFINSLKQALPLPFLHIVNLTLSYLSQQGIRSTTLLSTSGTVQSRIYHEEALKQGIQLHLPQHRDQKQISTLIDAIKGGTPPLNLQSDLMQIVNTSLSQTETVILGCTELPLPLKGRVLQNIIDPMDILAKESIETLGYSLNQRGLSANPLIHFC